MLCTTGYSPYKVMFGHKSALFLIDIEDQFESMLLWENYTITVNKILLNNKKT